MLIEIDGKLSSGMLFYVAVSELLARKNVAPSDVATALSLERSTIFLMYQMDGVHSASFVNILNHSQAVTTTVDWAKVADVIEGVLKLDEAKIHKVKAHSDKTYVHLTAKLDLKKLFERELALAFSRHLMTAVFSYNQTSSTHSKASVPANVMQLLCQLRGNQFTLVSHLLTMHSAISISFDSVKLTTALSSYHASSSANDAVIALIKSGANYHFVNTYNGMRQVDREYFNNWRTVLLAGKTQKEKIAVKISHEIWHFYNEQVSLGLPMFDVYMSMHRHFGLRIDTLYNEVQRLIKTEAEQDDDDFMDLKNCINE